MTKSQNQLREVSLHAEVIGKSFAKTAFHLTQFITFMRKQKMTVQVLRVATKVFNDKVRKAIGNKQYAQNLLLTVWDVLYKRKFQLLRLNCNANRIMNLKNLNQADAVVTPKSKKPKVSEDPKVSNDLDDDACIMCGDVGFVVECNKCLKCAHPECVGLTNAVAKKLAFWYCPACSGVAITQPLLRDASVTLTVSETTTPAVSGSSFELEPTLGPPASSPIITIVSFGDAVVDSQDAGASVEAATPPESAPVTVAPTLGTAAQLSEKMTVLSVKLMQVAQPGFREQAYKNYLSEIERFLFQISQQLDDDSARARAEVCDSVASPPDPVVIPLPAMAGKFPTDVPSDKIIWTEWNVCVVRGVGACHVWNVRDEEGVFDNIAVQVDGSAQRLCVNNRTILCDAKAREVTCLETGQMEEQQRQRIVFVNVCDDFHTWAMSKVARDYTESHFAGFLAKGQVVVECGKQGNCFYHSCLFMLKMFAPDLQINGVDIKAFNHLSLRVATVEHLRNRYREINAVCGHELSVPVLTLMSRGFDSERTEQDVVTAYCDKYVKTNVVPEEPSVYALAHLLQTTIIVHHITLAEPALAGAGATAAAGQLELWCNDVHYQAVVEARRIVLSDKASTSRGYKDGNWVHAREVTLSVVEQTSLPDK